MDAYVTGCSHLRSCENNGWCIESGELMKCNCSKTTLGDYCELGIYYKG